MDNFENIENAITELNKEQYIPQSIEFMVKEDFVNNLPQIVSNLEQIEAWAIEQTKEDRTAVLLTDEDFDAARDRCAQLNKIIKIIDEKRKVIKKSWNQPYDVFEKATKRVTNVLLEARENKWSQITKAEEEAKAQKKEKLREYWDKLNSESIGGYKRFEQIFDSKWLNKSTRIEAATAEMDKLFEAQISDIMALRALNSEFELSLIEYYKDGYTVSEVISYNSRLVAQKQAKIEREQKSQGNTQKIENAVNLQQNNDKQKIDENTDELMRMEFYVECTKEQLNGLGKYLREHGIRYGRIEN